MRPDLKTRLDKLMRECDRVALRFHASAAIGFLATFTQLYAIKLADTQGKIAFSCGLYLVCAHFWMRDLRRLNFALHEIRDIKQKARAIVSSQD